MGDSPLRRVGWFQQLTPLLLLALAVGVWIGAGPAEEQSLQGWLWSDGLLRLGVSVLALYTLLLISEQQRLRHDFLEVIRTMQETLRQARGAEPGAGSAPDGVEGAPGGPAPTPKQQRQAVAILIQGLRAGEAGVREVSHQQLVRIAQRDLGEDPAAWEAWLESQPQ